MRPQGDRVLRRERRRALRGVPTGRRATHAVLTTYGHRQRERDRIAAMAPLFAAIKAEREATAA